MTSVRQLWRGGRIAFFALAGWLIVHGAALAQVQGQPKPIAGEGVNSMVYVMAYGLVILGIALGMLFVCRSSNRRERAKPEQFGESKMLKPEDDE
jgi:hypothetical protein